MIKNSNKNALIILPRFYSYAKTIKDAFERKGYSVTLFYEEPPRIKFLTMRKLQKVFHTDTFYKKFNDKLYKKITKEKKRFDLLFVIRGNVLKQSFIERISNTLLNDGATKVYYTWDSLGNLHHKGDLANAFDKKYSFDRIDVTNKEGWNFLPLFYFDSFNEDVRSLDNCEYDATCICSLNKYRYQTVSDIKDANPNLNIYAKFQIGRFLFLVKRLTDPFFRKVKKQDVIYKPIPAVAVRELYDKSKAVLDVTHENQKGLSMRTIESIGMNKKIITNNQDVKNYDFFTPSNVFVYSKDNLKLDQDWLEEENFYPKNIHDKYSIDHWVTTIIS